MSKISVAKCYVVRAWWLCCSSSSYFLVSQFTLLASTMKGSKPDFHGALGGDQAKELYQAFFSKVQQGYDASKVKNGVFQAMMVMSSNPPWTCTVSDMVSGGSTDQWWACKSMIVLWHVGDSRTDTSKVTLEMSVGPSGQKWSSYGAGRFMKIAELLRFLRT